MWNLPFTLLSNAIVLSSLLGTCNAIPQAATSAAPSPSPSVSPIPWATKVDALHDEILRRPDQNATKGFSYGPSIQLNFADGDCLQVRFYNWDCFHDLPYKMRGVANWLDSIGARNSPPIADLDRYRQYSYGYYSDPDNGWNFYNSARLSFGACGNRGPQSACGVTWCVNKEGKSLGQVYPQPEIPAGFSPYADPNDRNITCAWLTGNETTTWRV